MKKTRPKNCRLLIVPRVLFNRAFTVDLQKFHNHCAFMIQKEKWIRNCSQLSRWHLLTRMFKFSTKQCIKKKTILTSNGPISKQISPQTLVLMATALTSIVSLPLMVSYYSAHSCTERGSNLKNFLHTKSIYFQSTHAWGNSKLRFLKKSTDGPLR